MRYRIHLICAAPLLLLLAVTTVAAAGHRPPHYRTAAARDPAKLNVHIVCHSHDDSGCECGGQAAMAMLSDWLCAK